MARYSEEKLAKKALKNEERRLGMVFIVLAFLLVVAIIW
jgi:hypothetical protein